MQVHRITVYIAVAIVSYLVEFLTLHYSLSSEVILIIDRLCLYGIHLCGFYNLRLLKASYTIRNDERKLGYFPYTIPLGTCKEAKPVEQESQYTQTPKLVKHRKNQNSQSQT